MPEDALQKTEAPTEPSAHRIAAVNFMWGAAATLTGVVTYVVSVGKTATATGALTAATVSFAGAGIVALGYSAIVDLVRARRPKTGRPKGGPEHANDRQP